MRRLFNITPPRPSTRLGWIVRIKFGSKRIIGLAHVHTLNYSSRRTCLVFRFFFSFWLEVKQYSRASLCAPDFDKKGMPRIRRLMKCAENRVQLESDNWLHGNIKSISTNTPPQANTPNSIDAQFPHTLLSLKHAHDAHAEQRNSEHTE